MKPIITEPTKFAIPFMRNDFFILKIFSFFPDESPNAILTSGKIVGFSNDENSLNEIISSLHQQFGTSVEILSKSFLFHDCLASEPTLLLENSNDFFLLSSPAVATKTICEKKLGDELSGLYFNSLEHENLFEIAIDYYAKYDGAWFVPYSFLTNHKNNALRKKIITELNKSFSSITVYDSESADVFNSIYCSFILSSSTSIQPHLDISFLNHPTIKVDIDWDGAVCPEWRHIMKSVSNSLVKTNLDLIQRDNTDLFAVSCNLKKSVHTKIQVDQHTLNTISSNYLFAQLQDKSSNSPIRLLNKQELIEEFSLDVSENSPIFIDNSVKYIYPIYFSKKISKENQENIKIHFNSRLSEMRLQFNSLFLSNVVNSNSKKKITINEATKFIDFIQNSLS